MRSANIPERVHMIGIGGVHMSAIARILLAWGHTISGSDQKANATTAGMERLGVRVAIGHAAENIGDAQLVVATSASTFWDNPEIAEAKRREVPVIKRAEMVARLMDGRFSIAVAGTHGKTTTSGLIAHMLVEAGLDPTYLIGGEVRTLGTNAAPGEGKYIVVEADEFDRAFLSYAPDVAIITNIEADHLDIYRTMDALEDAFAQFAANVPQDGHLIACADDPRLRQLVGSGAGVRAHDVQTYALDHDATWTAGVPKPEERGQAFDVRASGRGFGSFTIELAGRHNVRNALAGIAAGDTIGLDRDVIRGALASYRGAERRFEHVGEAGGVTVMDDYAHHPTEVRTTVAMARERFGRRRLVALFQPHTYSRTAYLLDEWRTCFEGIDALYIAETYAARETPEAGIGAAELAAAVASPRATYAGSLDEAAARIAGELRAGDVFITVGAGDVETVGPKVLESLRRGGA
ncbi:MAG: UDP-N-acetylmuramate--L-alanine ligase [Dehalococcoidia bacterium]|nr:UDP-N-acetylmuramate--L-alanine ligase [Dehalococcoidia bacterium]